MPRASVSPETRLLAAQIKLKDPKAIARVAASLKKHAGNLAHTALALGIARQTLYRWTWELPELKEALDEHARGNVGRPPVAKKKAGVAGRKRTTTAKS